MTAEFGDLESLRTHACQVWEIEQSIRLEHEAELALQAAQSSSRLGNRSQGSRGPQGDAHLRETQPKADVRIREPRTREADHPRPVTTTKRSCYSCGGKGHIARDKECPNYSERAPPRARVAAQRVLESYSDEEDEYPDQERAVRLQRAHCTLRRRLVMLTARPRPESRGLGPAWQGLGFKNLRPEPEPAMRAWPGSACLLNSYKKCFFF
ncbi:hypothetical protein C8J57DRAFT_1225727 [Mycena rebaudengoi]|nr:hypothetical protein C8J57DRAFT_1225727 [Mycena rebaudengoi]